ncbi:MAG: hypothetical protein ACM3ZT_00985 [Bacillota bacterium]
MKILTQTLLLTATLLPVTTVAADAQAFDVLKAMSVSDFRASGLDKLSDAQVKALNAWFQNYERQHACPPSAGAAVTAGQAPAVAASASDATDSFPLVAHMVGKFTGWNGTTDFALDNGQVWEQVDDSQFSAGAVMNPRITISRGLMNSYYLSVEGVRETVLVKRIKNP